MTLTSELWRPLLAAAQEETVTLLYAARDPERNNAVALRDYLARQAEHGANFPSGSGPAR